MNEIPAEKIKASKLIKKQMTRFKGKIKRIPFGIGEGVGGEKLQRNYGDIDK